jgi:uncharacterized delta-60 repeat protein
MKTRLLSGFSLFLIISLTAACVSSDDCDGFSPECWDIPPPPSSPPPPPSSPRPPPFDPTVNSVAPALDGSDDVYVGGDFTIYKDSAANRIARLNNNGSLDTGFVTGTGFNGEVLFIAPANNGSGDVYVGGYFTSYNGTDVGGIARLNLDGTLDTFFDTGTGFDSDVRIVAPAIDGSGDVYVGSYSTSYNGTDVGSGLIRLNDDGSLDAGFITGSGWGQHDIALATDGSGDIYVRGNSSPNFARLNDDGSIDADFDTGPSGFNGDQSVWAVAAATDGSGDVYVGGFFNDYNGTATKGIVRLNSDGSLDTGFVVGDEFERPISVITVAIDGSGDIYADTKDDGGIRRINDDGSLDTGFATGSGFNSSPRSIALATDGSGDVYLGGRFTHYNASPVDSLVRLTAGGVLVR